MIDAFFRQTPREIHLITLPYQSPAGPLIEVLALLFLHKRPATMVRVSYWQTEFAQIFTHLRNNSFSSVCSRKLQQTPARFPLPLIPPE